MTEEPIPLAALAVLPIFALMSDEERQQLVDIASNLRFEPGDMVLTEGQVSQNLLVVLEGKCEVVKTTKAGREVKLADLKANDVFGEMSFFSSAPHSASVRALNRLRVLRFERRDYDLLIKENCLAAFKMAYNMIDDVSDRVRCMDDWVSKLMAEEEEEETAERVSEWSTFRDRLFTDWKF